MIIGNPFPSLYQIRQPVFSPRIEARGIVGILLDALFGPKKPQHQLREIRKAAHQPGRFVDPATGEITTQSRKVIIG